MSGVNMSSESACADVFPLCRFSEMLVKPFEPPQ